MADWYAGLISRHSLPITVLGPAPCPLSRIKERWRWHVLLKGPSPALGRVVRYGARRLGKRARRPLKLENFSKADLQPLYTLQAREAGLPRPPEHFSTLEGKLALAEIPSDFSALKEGEFPWHATGASSHERSLRQPLPPDISSPISSTTTSAAFMCCLTGRARSNSDLTGVPPDLPGHSHLPADRFIRAEIQIRRTCGVFVCWMCLIEEVKICLEATVKGSGSPPHGWIFHTLLRIHANGVVGRLVIERPRGCGRCGLGRRSRKGRARGAEGFGLRTIGWLVL